MSFTAKTTTLGPIGACAFDRSAAWRHSLRIVSLAGLLWVVSIACGAKTLYDQSADTLSVRFEKLPIAQALDEVSQATAIVFVAPADTTATVSLSFEALPLEAGIERLLNGWNYIAVRSSTTRRLERVVLTGPVDDSARRSAAPIPLVAPARVAKELVLERRDAHFVAAGRIDGVAASFLIDTGASTVALSDEMAKRAGLRFGAAYSVDTAAGRSRAYRTQIARLSLGDFELRNVSAMILPSMDLSDRVLLGMNVLEHFDIDHRGDRLTLRSRSTR